ncbi:MAG TPA: GNAT family N-acetyltransferase [Acidimicrobiales bacterium]|nr:GNAT family N-acetyltransferase [Acidimicrobiales bacterium]
MDDRVRQEVDAYFAARFGLEPDFGGGTGVLVVAGRTDSPDVLLLRIGGVCVVEVAPGQLETARQRLSGLSADEAFTPALALELAGPGSRALGPSWHGYLAPATTLPERDGRVLRLPPSDRRLIALRARCDPAEWAEGGFPLDPAEVDETTTALYGFELDGELVAAGNMTEWRGRPADVGLLTRADQRGRGLAATVAAAMVADWLSEVGIVRYRALFTNRASLAVAAGLGFEGHGANIVARRRRPDARPDH